MTATTKDCRYEKSAVVTYMRLVHTHGLWSRNAKAFKDELRNDSVFIRHADAVDALFLNREEILNALEGGRK